MTYTKLHDSLWGDPKWMQASTEARALWVTALSWCGDQLTDGQVPEFMLPMFRASVKDAEELVRVGLWEPLEGHGWVFHDWSDHQRTRAQVEAEREAGRARQAAHRKQRQNPTSNGVTTVVSDDANTIQSNTSEREAPQAAPEPAKKPRAQARGTRLPHDWQPAVELVEWTKAEAPGLNIEREVGKFRDYWSSLPGQRALKSDWTATWRNWVRRAAESLPVVKPQQAPSAGADQAKERQRLWLEQRGVTLEQYEANKDRPGWLETLKAKAPQVSS